MTIRKDWTRLRGVCLVLNRTWSKWKRIAERQLHLTPWLLRCEFTASMDRKLQLPTRSTGILQANLNDREMAATNTLNEIHTAKLLRQLNASHGNWFKTSKTSQPHLTRVGLFG